MTRAKWLVSGTPVTLITCGPSACSMFVIATRGSVPARSELA